MAGVTKYSPIDNASNPAYQKANALMQALFNAEGEHKLSKSTKSIDNHGDYGSFADSGMSARVERAATFALVDSEGVYLTDESEKTVQGSALKDGKVTYAGVIGENMPGWFEDIGSKEWFQEWLKEEGTAAKLEKYGLSLEELNSPDFGIEFSSASDEMARAEEEKQVGDDLLRELNNRILGFTAEDQTKAIPESQRLTDTSDGLGFGMQVLVDEYFEGAGVAGIHPSFQAQTLDIGFWKGPGGAIWALDNAARKLEHEADPTKTGPYIPTPHPGPGNCAGFYDDPAYDPPRSQYTSAIDGSRLGKLTPEQAAAQRAYYVPEPGKPAVPEGLDEKINALLTTDGKFDPAKAAAFDKELGGFYKENIQYYYNFYDRVAKDFNNGKDQSNPFYQPKVDGERVIVEWGKDGAGVRQGRYGEGFDSRINKNIDSKNVAAGAAEKIAADYGIGQLISEIGGGDYLRSQDASKPSDPRDSVLELRQALVKLGYDVEKSGEGAKIYDAGLAKVMSEIETGKASASHVLGSGSLGKLIDQLQEKYPDGINQTATKEAGSESMSGGEAGKLAADKEKKADENKTEEAVKPTRYVVVRHAETLANEKQDGKVKGKATNSDYNKFSDEGKRQIAQLADNMDGVIADRIYTSSIDRCQDTIAPAAEKMGKEAEVLRGLQEFGRSSVGGKSDETQLAVDAIEAEHSKSGDTVVIMTHSISGNEVIKKLTDNSKDTNVKNAAIMVFEEDPVTGKVTRLPGKAEDQTWAQYINAGREDSQSLAGAKGEVKRDNSYDAARKAYVEKVIEPHIGKGDKEFLADVVREVGAKSDVDRANSGKYVAMCEYTHRWAEEQAGFRVFDSSAGWTLDTMIEGAKNDAWNDAHDNIPALKNINIGDPLIFDRNDDSYLTVDEMKNLPKIEGKTPAEVAADKGLISDPDGHYAVVADVTRDTEGKVTAFTTIEANKGEDALAKYEYEIRDEGLYSHFHGKLINDKVLGYVDLETQMAAQDVDILAAVEKSKENSGAGEKAAPTKTLADLEAQIAKGKSSYIKPGDESDLVPFIRQKLAEVFPEDKRIVKEGDAANVFDGELATVMAELEGPDDPEKPEEQVFGTGGLKAFKATIADPEAAREAKIARVEAASMIQPIGFEPGESRHHAGFEAFAKLYKPVAEEVYKAEVKQFDKLEALAAESRQDKGKDLVVISIGHFSRKSDPFATKGKGSYSQSTKHGTASAEEKSALQQGACGFYEGYTEPWLTDSDGKPIEGIMTEVTYNLTQAETIMNKLMAEGKAVSIVSRSRATSASSVIDEMEAARKDYGATKDKTHIRELHYDSRGDQNQGYVFIVPPESKGELHKESMKAAQETRAAFYADPALILKSGTSEDNPSQKSTDYYGHMNRNGSKGGDGNIVSEWTRGFQQRAAHCVVLVEYGTGDNAVGARDLVQNQQRLADATANGILAEIAVRDATIAKGSELNKVELAEVRAEAYTVAPPTSQEMLAAKEAKSKSGSETKKTEKDSPEIETTAQAFAAMKEQGIERVVFYGDSHADLTHDYNSAAIKKAGFETLNLGNGGAGLRNGGTDGKGLKDTDSIKKGDLVYISVGANDGGMVSKADIEAEGEGSYRQDFRDLVQSVKDKGGVPVIVGMPEPTEVYTSELSDKAGWLAKYDAVHEVEKEVAADLGVQFYDYTKLSQAEAPRSSSDGLHMKYVNKKGQPKVNIYGDKLLDPTLIAFANSQVRSEEKAAETEKDSIIRPFEPVVHRATQKDLPEPWKLADQALVDPKTAEHRAFAVAHVMEHGGSHYQEYKFTQGSGARDFSSGVWTVKAADGQIHQFPSISGGMGKGAMPYSGVGVGYGSKEERHTNSRPLEDMHIANAVKEKDFDTLGGSASKKASRKDRYGGYEGDATMFDIVGKGVDAEANLTTVTDEDGVKTHGYGNTGRFGSVGHVDKESHWKPEKTTGHQIGSEGCPTFLSEHIAIVGGIYVGDGEKDGVASGGKKSGLAVAPTLDPESRVKNVGTDFAKQQISAAVAVYNTELSGFQDRLTAADKAATEELAKTEKEKSLAGGDEKSGAETKPEMPKDDKGVEVDKTKIPTLNLPEGYTYQVASLSRAGEVVGNEAEVEDKMASANKVEVFGIAAETLALVEKDIGVDAAKEYLKELKEPVHVGITGLSGKNYNQAPKTVADITDRMITDIAAARAENGDKGDIGAIKADVRRDVAGNMGLQTVGASKASHHLTDDASQFRVFETARQNNTETSPARVNRAVQSFAKGLAEDGALGQIISNRDRTAIDYTSELPSMQLRQHAMHAFTYGDGMDKVSSQGVVGGKQNAVGAATRGAVSIFEKDGELLVATYDVEGSRTPLYTGKKWQEEAGIINDFVSTMPSGWIMPGAAPAQEQPSENPSKDFADRFNALMAHMQTHNETLASGDEAAIKESSDTLLGLNDELRSFNSTNAETLNEIIHTAAGIEGNAQIAAIEAQLENFEMTSAEFVNSSSATLDASLKAGEFSTRLDALMTEFVAKQSATTAQDADALYKSNDKLVELNASLQEFAKENAGNLDNIIRAAAETGESPNSEGMLAQGGAVHLNKSIGLLDANIQRTVQAQSFNKILNSVITERGELQNAINAGVQADVTKLSAQLTASTDALGAFIRDNEAGFDGIIETGAVIQNSPAASILGTAKAQKTTPTKFMTEMSSALGEQVKAITAQYSKDDSKKEEVADAGMGAEGSNSDAEAGGESEEKEEATDSKLTKEEALEQYAVMETRFRELNNARYDASDALAAEGDKASIVAKVDLRRGFKEEVEHLEAMSNFAKDNDLKEERSYVAEKFSQAMNSGYISEESDWFADYIDGTVDNPEKDRGESVSREDLVAKLESIEVAFEKHSLDRHTSAAKEFYKQQYESHGFKSLKEFQESVKESLAKEGLEGFGVDDGMGSQSHVALLNMARARAAEPTVDFANGIPTYAILTDVEDIPNLSLIEGFKTDSQWASTPSIKPIEETTAVVFKPADAIAGTYVRDDAMVVATRLLEGAKSRAGYTDSVGVDTFGYGITYLDNAEGVEKEYIINRGKDGNSYHNLEKLLVANPDYIKQGENIVLASDSNVIIAKPSTKQERVKYGSHVWPVGTMELTDAGFGTTLVTKLPSKERLTRDMMGHKAYDAAEPHEQLWAQELGYNINTTNKKRSAPVVRDFQNGVYPEKSLMDKYTRGGMGGLVDRRWFTTLCATGDTVAAGYHLVNWKQQDVYDAGYTPDQVVAALAKYAPTTPDPEMLYKPLEGQQLKQGNDNPRVIVAQVRLAELGLYKGPIDGVFTSEVGDSVEKLNKLAFGQDYDDGARIVGGDTIHAMRAAKAYNGDFDHPEFQMVARARLGNHEQAKELLAAAESGNLTATLYERAQEAAETINAYTFNTAPDQEAANAYAKEIHAAVEQTYAVDTSRNGALQGSRNPSNAVDIVLSDVDRIRMEGIASGSMASPVPFGERLSKHSERSLEKIGGRNGSQHVFGNTDPKRESGGGKYVDIFLTEGYGRRVVSYDDTGNISETLGSAKGRHGALDVRLMKGDPVYARHGAVIYHISDHSDPNKSSISYLVPETGAIVVCNHTNPENNWKVGDVVKPWDTLGKVGGDHLDSQLYYATESGALVDMTPMTTIDMGSLAVAFKEEDGRNEGHYYKKDGSPISDQRLTMNENAALVNGEFLSQQEFADFIGTSSELVEMGISGQRSEAQRMIAERNEDKNQNLVAGAFESIGGAFRNIGRALTGKSSEQNPNGSDTNQVPVAVPVAVPVEGFDDTQMTFASNFGTQLQQRVLERLEASGQEVNTENIAQMSANVATHMIMDRGAIPRAVPVDQTFAKLCDHACEEIADSILRQNIGVDGFITDPVSYAALIRRGEEGLTEEEVKVFQAISTEIKDRLLKTASTDGVDKANETVQVTPEDLVEPDKAKQTKQLAQLYHEDKAKIEDVPEVEGEETAKETGVSPAEVASSESAKPNPGASVA